MTSVVDTNVILVANQQHENISAGCVTACTLRLQAIMGSGRIALDDAFRVLTEYQNKTQSKRAKGPGDAFVKWALQNRTNTQRCDQIAIRSNPDRGFEEFPSDAALREFDADDRKFVAVAAAHPGKPPILQASDSKWLTWSPALARNGITIDFLCRADAARFLKRKTRR